MANGTWSLESGKLRFKSYCPLAKVCRIGQMGLVSAEWEWLNFIREGQRGLLMKVTFEQRSEGSVGFFHVDR